MERAGAALGGLAFVAAIFGGIVLIRILTRALYAAIWFAETVATFAFALLVGYLVYRILLGSSDDPRRIGDEMRIRLNCSAVERTLSICDLSR